MPRRFLSIALLTFAVAATAQQQIPAMPANGQPFGGPILNTPNATFTTPAPEAGISDAGRVGISVGTTTETAPASPAANATDMNSAGTAIVPVGTAAPAQAPTNDLGVSISVNNPEAVAAPLSVAEAANRYKNANAAVNARSLSNEDVEQIIKNKNGVTIAAASPQNTLPAESSQTAEPAAPQTAQSSPAVVQPQASTTQATADNGTTPAINDNQQTNDSEGSTRLPATATFLPLLGVMGLASGGVGLWFRKYKK